MCEHGKSPTSFKLNPNASPFTLDARSTTQFLNRSNSSPSTSSLPLESRNISNLTYSQVAKASTPTSNLKAVICKAPEPKAICTYHLRGICRHGDRCRFAHGSLCSKCNLHIFHPDQTPKEKQYSCTLSPKVEREEEIECCICMEKVRSSKCGRFGLLNCEHPFCLECIRHWRSNSGMESSLLRTCPICRSTSYYIIPSYTWITDKEEKEKMAEDYKKNMRTKHCKYFKFGEGQCPFGSSCFYDHVYPDGTRQEFEVRKIKTAEDELRILGQVKLSDFFEAYNSRDQF